MGHRVPGERPLPRSLGTSCPPPFRRHESIFRLAEALAATHFQGALTRRYTCGGGTSSISWQNKGGTYLEHFPGRPMSPVASEMAQPGPTEGSLATDALSRERQHLRLRSTSGKEHHLDNLPSRAARCGHEPLR